MRIIHRPPFATGSIIWQEQPGQWTLTLVCKATFSLKQGQAIVAPELDEINEQDNHWDDDPNRSVYAPSDLVPYKPSPEVLLVGSAFAPRGEPVRSLFARLIVGQLDKSIEVYGQRSFSPEGLLVDGPKWTQMSLRYERAATGDGSWNPVGVDPSIPDAYGRRAIPNLVPPAFPDNELGGSIPAIGFGPIAARWPVRREKLGTLASVFEQGTWMEIPIGMHVDGLYFQSAPQDQFVEELRADETIVLEHLHPDIERLVTRLPGVKPRARVELDGVPAWELMLVADTLWIDTNRAIATLTFRGQLPLESPEPSGTIYVGAEFPGEPVQFPESEREARSWTPSVEKGRQAGVFDEMEATVDGSVLDARTGNVDGRLAPPVAPALPWDRGATPPPKPPPSAPRAPKTADDQGDTDIFPAPASTGLMPSWLGTRMMDHVPTMNTHAPAPPGNTPIARMAAAPPPPVSQMLRGHEAPPPSVATASHRAAGIEPPATTPPAFPRPGVPIAPPPAPLPGLPVPPPVRGAAPTLLGIVAAPVPGAPAPPIGTTGTTFGQQAVLAAAKAQGAMSPSTSSSSSSSSSFSQSFEKDRSRPGSPDAQLLATAAFLGATEASHAAASAPMEEKDDKPVRDKPSASVGQTATTILINLLWFDAEVLPPRLEENPNWKRILNVEPPVPEKKDDDDDFASENEWMPKAPPVEPPAKSETEKAKDDKSRVSKVISKASSTIDIDGAMVQAINDDGVFDPPLCVVAGELELPFDEVETLKVLTSAASPLATADKKVKETIDLANEALGTSLGQSHDVAMNFSMKVRDAWQKANRHLPADYLDVHSRRVLLEQRKYQMREFMDAQWIRALLHGVSGEKPIPTYLPTKLAKKLPLIQRFSARLIVEVQPNQDQHETHPHALVAFALARTLPARGRR